MSILALDFGTDHLKLAQIETEGNGKPVISKSIMVPLEYGDISGTFTIPQIKWDIVKTRLTQAFEQIASKTKDVHILMPDQLTKLLFIKVENVKGAGVKHDYIKWRLKKLLPTSVVEGCSIDFSILGSEERISESGPVKDYEIVVHLVKLDLLDTLASHLADLKKRVAVCDSTSINLLALYSKGVSAENAKDDFALINVGHEVTTVNIAKAGTLSYQRVIELAGRHFSELFMEVNSLSDLKAARNYMHASFYFPTFENDHDYAFGKFDEIRKVFGRWIHEVSMTFKFYHGSHHGPTYPKIILTGGAAGIKHFPGFLGKLFSSSVTRFDATSVASFKDPSCPPNQFLPLIGFAWR